MTKIIPRPPIVTILGHVDHGKTTLLDTIRKTNIANKEYGGITQHIGAYQVEVNPKGLKTSRKITFIDTPGHAAFSQMRGRGAKVADIAILVVAGNDGIMPQTIESISHIKDAKLPCIVAVNKIDLPDINLEKIKKQLTRAGLSLEEYGGDIPVVPLSAKTGENLNKLLEMILLLSELNQVREDNPNMLEGVVIESSLSKQKGPVATVIVKNSNLKTADSVVCENQEFRVRALYSWNGKQLEKVSASDPVEILGWKKLPSVGSILYAKNQSQISKPPPHAISEPPSKTLSVPPPTALNEEILNLIIKADTIGSLEALTSSLKKDINIILSAVGNISESDVLLAKTTKALIVGFNINPPESVIKLATSEKVILKTYNIIYELLDEITDVVESFKKGNLVEILGSAKVIATFNIKNETIFGVKVTSGRIARGDQVKIMRGEVEVGRAKIKSLRHQKEDITKAEQGKEAGLILSQKLEILTGDSIISIG